MKTYTTEELRLISQRRHEEDQDIKHAIKEEFKARFKKVGQGLDFYCNADDYVYGMLDATGSIGKMYLGLDGDIKVTLVQEYEDLEEEFESRYFACDDWPQLLILVREGIEKGWYIEDDEEDE